MCVCVCVCVFKLSFSVFQVSPQSLSLSLSLSLCLSPSLSLYMSVCLSLLPPPPPFLLLSLPPPPPLPLLHLHFQTFLSLFTTTHPPHTLHQHPLFLTASTQPTPPRPTTLSKSLSTAGIAGSRTRPSYRLGGLSRHRAFITLPSVILPPYFLLPSTMDVCLPSFGPSASVCMYIAHSQGCLCNNTYIATVGIQHEFCSPPRDERLTEDGV